MNRCCADEIIFLFFICFIMLKPLDLFSGFFLKHTLQNLYKYSIHNHNLGCSHIFFFHDVGSGRSVQSLFDIIL